MTKPDSIGIKRLDSIHYYVHDLERSRAFYTEKMDFEEVGLSSPEMEKRGRQKSAVFRAGRCVVICSEPAGKGGSAWRFLQKHPDGIGTLCFEVHDIGKTFRLLEQRGGTPISDVETVREEGGTFGTFAIATPVGDTNFRFIQRENFPKIFPGLHQHATPKGGQNRLGFTHFDHVTTNFRTLSPALLWMENVLGLEKFWGVQFHTKDAKGSHADGSGLRSVVMWDPGSGVKFANNEPWRPNFHKSQVSVFAEDHRGEGVQHIAIAANDIIAAVRSMRKNGIEFMSTPGPQEPSVGKTPEDEAQTLRDLQILADGNSSGKYLMQIFLKDSASLYNEKQAGPFFYEIIQRKGNQSFTEGNIRALFDSIESEQEKEKQT